MTACLVTGYFCNGPSSGECAHNINLHIHLHYNSRILYFNTCGYSDFTPNNQLPLVVQLGTVHTWSRSRHRKGGRHQEPTQCSAQHTAWWEALRPTWPAEITWCMKGGLRVKYTHIRKQIGAPFWNTCSTWRKASNSKFRSVSHARSPLQSWGFPDELNWQSLK